MKMPKAMGYQGKGKNRSVDIKKKQFLKTYDP
jgi:hypothetical protein